MQNRSIDYMRVHLSQVGGITPARKLQMFCEQYGVRICWHGPGDMSRWLMQPTSTSIWPLRIWACRSGAASNRPTSLSRS